MINLAPEDVRLQVAAASKAEAIRQVGAVLVSRGRLQLGYIDSMLAREAQANTYLGNRIAIPHGQPQQRDVIVTTGIAVLQIPAGVEWNPGEVVRVMAKGSDAIQVLMALQQVVEKGLEEEEVVAPPAVQLPVLTLESPGIAGVAASPGLAMVPLHRCHRTQVEFAATASDPIAEQQRLREAIAAADRDLADLYRTILERSGKAKAAIFQAHREFLADPDLQQAALNQIPPNHSAPWAWQQGIEASAKELEALADPILSGRVADVRDVGQRVLARLVGTGDLGTELPDHPVMLMADDLTPPDTAGLNPDQILGFCTAVGGATSHTAIIARSLNIPAVAGAGAALLELPEGATAILDGDQGSLYPYPTEADLEQARHAQAERAQLRDVEQQTCFQPALTSDGHRIEVVANIGSPDEAAQAIQAGGEGVGLLRTEFLFLNRNAPPTEEEQMDRGHPTLAKQADALHPAVLRAIHQTVQGAAAAGKWVGVCGGLAGHPQGAMILAGLGVKELSMDVPSIPKVKARRRGTSMQQMRRLAQKALACRTTEEVKAL